MSRFHKPYQEYFIVESGDQNMVVTGNLIASDASVNISDGQLAGVAAKKFGTYDYYEFLAATATVALIPEIKIVQGTPANSDNSSAWGWFNQDKGWVETPTIKKDTIQSVGTFLPNVGKYSSVFFKNLPTVVEDKEYSINVFLDSVRKDRDFGPNEDQTTYSYSKADLSGVGDNKDYVVQHLLYQINLASKKNNLQPSWLQNRQKQQLALAINTSGSTTGTAIGTLKVGDTVPVQTDGTTTFNYVVEKPFIQMLTDAIANDAAITASSTIELIDLANAGTGQRATGTFTVTNNTNLAGDTITIGTTALEEGTDFDAGSDDTAPELAVTATNLAAAIDAVSGVSATSSGAVVTVVYDTYGTAGNSVVWTYTQGSGVGGTISGSGTLTGGSATNIDSFLLVGLDHDTAEAYDDIDQVKVTIDATLGGQFYTDGGYTKTVTSGAEETKGTARQLRNLYNSRAFAQTGSQQLTGHADELLLAPNYISTTDTQLYTHTVIDVREDTEKPSGGEYIANQFRVHILVLATDDSASATPAGGGITTSSASSTAVSDLESVLGDWIQGNANVEWKGSATSSTTFV